MTTNQAREAAEIIDEVEDDALQNDEPLTVDQRIAVAAIRATLASVQAAMAQAEVLRRNGDIMERHMAATEATEATTDAAGVDGDG